MGKIFVPSDTTYNKCYVVQSENVIRAYDTIPNHNLNYKYRDYYINSDYIYRDGSGSWSNYSTLPICLSDNVITNDFYYRTDLDSILIIFTIFLFIIVILPYKIIKRIFGWYLDI